MTIDRAYLESYLADLRRQLQDALVASHRAQGAILVVEDILARLDAKDEKPAEGGAA